MTPDDPINNKGLEKLLAQMETNLSKTIERVEDNVNSRMDKFEASMEQYVLKEVFHIEILNLRNELYASKRAAEEVARTEAKRLETSAITRAAELEAKQERREQKVSWGIAIAAVLVTVINVWIG